MGITRQPKDCKFGPFSEKKQTGFHLVQNRTTMKYWLNILRRFKWWGSRTAMKFYTAYCNSCPDSVSEIYLPRLAQIGLHKGQFFKFFIKKSWDECFNFQKHEKGDHPLKWHQWFFLFCKHISSLIDFSRGTAWSGDFHIQRAERNSYEKTVSWICMKQSHCGKNRIREIWKRKKRSRTELH